MKLRYFVLALIVAGTAVYPLANLARAEDDDDSFEVEEHVAERDSDDDRPAIITPTTVVPTTATTTSLSHTQSGTPWAWYITRAAGITSLILLILVAAMGVGITTGFLFRYLSPTRSWWWHRASSIALIFSILTHVVALLFDRYLNFTLKDVLIPFATSFKPLYVALGVISFYLFWPVILSSLFWIQTKPRWWRLLHYLSFVMFISVFFHSILIGTDTRSWPMLTLYWVGGILFFGLAFYRLQNSLKRRS